MDDISRPNQSFGGEQNPTATTSAPVLDAPPTAGPPAPSPLAEPPVEPSPTPPSGHDDHQPPHSDTPAAMPHHSKTPVAAIVVAIIIALLLAGLTVYVYLKTKKDTPVPDDTPTTSQQSSTPKATTSDVDQANSDLDASLKEAEASEDVGSNDLSDTTLGL